MAVLVLVLETRRRSQDKGLGSLEAMECTLRHLANTLERSVRGGDAALYRITISRQCRRRELSVHVVRDRRIPLLA